MVRLVLKVVSVGDWFSMVRIHNVPFHDRNKEPKRQGEREQREEREREDEEGKEREGGGE